MPRIGDQYCVMWDSPTLFERVRGWNLPNLRHHKKRRSLLVPLPTPRPMAKPQGFGDLQIGEGKSEHTPSSKSCQK
ncbi:hypothetical protein ERO13_A10G190401v2 [Gossypium hirsutum]|uniref:Uncharacterized protein n=1 Tax=Gossypium mustelinum TaxID=34275 RepID=A0A5D2XPE0_GOSMU|nr:hypothetical protein ERO13_A10G190401v2 [Gossypium hirsutum]TYJ15816.1 hypothetical protein E1A91_A10G209100v1 [Gossypium mustelinum]